MRPNERPELDFHFEATEELIAQTESIDPIRTVLEKLALLFAGTDASREEDVVYREHVILAADKLTQLLAEAFQHPARGPCVFLSHARNDVELAEEIKEQLETGDDPASCFLAHCSMEPGTTWNEAIWQAIRGCRVFVPIVTAEVAKSNWCLPESGAAIGLKKEIVPVQRHTTEMPEVLRRFQAIRVHDSKQLRKLVRKLKELCTR